MDDLLTRPGPRPPEVTAAPPGVAPGSPAGESAGRWRRSVEQAKRVSSRLAAWDYFDALVLVLLVTLALGLRWRTLWTSYWGDEAIAIGIAVHPLRSLAHYLANDGSPPLFYVMLHFWMRLFGRSEPATHALSMVAGLLAIPAAWWSGDRLFGRRAAPWSGGAGGDLRLPRLLQHRDADVRLAGADGASSLSPASSWLIAGPHGATGSRPRCSWSPCSTSSTTACTCWRRP